MSDKEFLTMALSGKMSWTHENLQRAKDMQEKGLMKYECGMHSGWWAITEDGRKVLS